MTFNLILKVWFEENCLFIKKRRNKKQILWNTLFTKLLHSFASSMYITSIDTVNIQLEKHSEAHKNESLKVLLVNYYSKRKCNIHLDLQLRQNILKKTIC